MSNNFIRVLRNTELCATREAAIEKLQGKLATLQDGEICIASYGATWDAAKTILGVVRVKTVDSVAKRSYTIFDNEDIAGIAAKIQELDATVRGNLTEGDAVETGHVGVKVVEVDGKLTEVKVVESDIASAAELGTKNDASTVDTAFGRIAKEVADRATAITEAINGLGSSVAATNDGRHVLTGVTQANGVLSNKTEIQLANVAISGSAADVANAAIGGDTTHVAVAGTNVSDQITDIAATLKTVENSIAEAKDNDLKYRTVKVDVSTLDDNSNVKEAYQVVSYTGQWVDGTTIGTPVGEVIRIYKDATIHKIYLGYSDDTVNPSDGNTTTGTADEAHLSLNYVYIKDNGTYAMASVPVGNFLREAEFGNGLQVTNGEVSVKVDTTEGAENFLSVSNTGVKISGVQNAINTAIDGLTVTKSGTDGKVTVEVAQTKGLVSGVTVSTKGLALDSDVIKGVTVNGVDAQVSAEKKAIVTINGANTAVSNAYVATKYAEPFETKVGTKHIAAGDTVDAAFKKTENTISVLATEVISNEKVTTAAITELAKFAGVTNTDGVIKYTPDTNTTYLKTATSVHDATVKLDAAITTVDGKITALGNEALKSLNGSSAITVSGDTANSKTVSLKLDTTIAADAVGANALAVNANGLYLSNVWDCGTY